MNTKTVKMHSNQNNLNNRGVLYMYMNIFPLFQRAGVVTTKQVVTNVGREPNTSCRQKNGPKLEQVLYYIHAIAMNFIETLLQRKII